MNRAIAPQRFAARIPAPAFFLISASFHYLGPSFAILLFAHVQVLGVAWLRIASAAAIFMVWRPRSRRVFSLEASTVRTILLFGVVLAAMNSSFYLAVARLPLATVAAIEFLGTVLLALHGSRTPRNVAAVALAMLGVAAMAQVRFSGEPLGFVLAFANCALFMLYVILGHRVANSTNGSADKIDQLAASMLIAAVAVTPLGLGPALPAFSNPQLLAAGIGVGICSSVIPYVTDQLAMARLSRASFSLMLALLPACATVIGAFVLHQIPAARDILGIALVSSGVALHRQETA